MNEGDDRTALQAGDMEQANGNDALGEKGLPSFNSPVHIVVTSYRLRRHDPDGISAKACLDGLVALEILSDDDWNKVASVKFQSRKAGAEGERTIIEIIGE